MTLELRGTDLSVPATQNTAPVLEFHCLYSHDLRRKSKRWQDGFLRFHTFNRRIMVYDIPRNFIGDMHWTNPNDPTDGDELKLEKGILVQVGDGIGRMEQDISALFEKKKQARADRLEKQANTGYPELAGDSANFPHTPKPRPSEKMLVPAGMSHLRPRTLNSLLGTPLRNHGRSMIPANTPAPSRQIDYPRRPEAAEGEGPPKKQKRDYAAAAHPKDGYAGKLTPSILNLATPASARPEARPAIRRTTARIEKAPQLRPRDASKSPAAPSIPQLQNKAHKKRKSQVIEVESDAEASTKVVKKGAVAKKAARAPAPASQEKASSKSPIEVDAEEAQVEGAAIAKLRDLPVQPLRLAPRQPRNKLLCRDPGQIRQARLAREEARVISPQRKEASHKNNGAGNHENFSDFDIDPLTLSDEPSSEISLPEPRNQPLKTKPTNVKIAQPPAPKAIPKAPHIPPVPAQPKHIKPPLKAGPGPPRTSLKKSLSETDRLPPTTLHNAAPSAQERGTLRRSNTVGGQAPRAAGLGASFSEPEEARDLGPWSREAFDLFAWRPPDKSAAAVVEV
ncbi:MAG: hypothetical protein M1829_006648 [Trizodia sp. TS-e1964]|nr:MAG: hypothetical protein M1829_006648 [Trizodia sp. TS-e1964]